MKKDIRLHVAYLLAWATDLERDGDTDLAERLKAKAAILIDKIVSPQEAIVAA